MSYEEWLVLSQEERETLHRSWDTYAGERKAIAYMAAARLALASPRKILNLQVGNYHGGEYLLHMTVSKEEYASCPPMLEESFEGFRVVWLPLHHLQHSPEFHATLEGKWIAEQGDYEFTLRPTALEGGIDVTGNIRSTGEPLVISDVTINEECALFSAFDPLSNQSSQHILRLVDKDRCEDCTITMEAKFYVRSDANSP